MTHLFNILTDKYYETYKPHGKRRKSELDNLSTPHLNLASLFHANETNICKSNEMQSKKREKLLSKCSVTENSGCDVWDKHV